MLWQLGGLGSFGESFRGFSEEARTRGFASLTLVRFAFVNLPDFPIQQEAVNSGIYLTVIRTGLGEVSWTVRNGS